MKKTANALRCVGEKHDVKFFQGWGAKVLCGIGHYLKLPNPVLSESR